MALKLSTSTTGLKKISLKIKSLQDKTLIKKGMHDSGQFMVTSTEATYEKQKSPKNARWPKLSDRYQYRPDTDGVAKFWKDSYKVGRDSKPLQNTGEMRTSISYLVSGSGTSVIIGYGDRMNAEKARRHQFGITGDYRYQRTPNSRVKTRKMTPQKRPQIGFSTWRRVGSRTDRDTVKEIFRRIFADQLKK